MPEIKMCPKCGGKMKEIKKPAKYGPVKPGKYAKDLSEQWLYRYYCPKCEKEFSEGDLS